MRCTWLAANTGQKNRHLGTIAQLCRAISSQLRHVWTIGKSVKQRYLLYVSWKYGKLWPTNGWDRFGSLGHPCKFQRVLRLGRVTARTLALGVSKTLRRWTEGATYIRQGGHHVGHWPTFLVFLFSSPNLSGRRLDVRTSTHGVAIVRIYTAGLKYAARGSLKIQDAKMTQIIAIWASSHNFVRLYLRNWGIYRQSEKKLVKKRCPPHVLIIWWTSAY